MAALNHGRRGLSGSSFRMDWLSEPEKVGNMVLGRESRAGFTAVAALIREAAIRILEDIENSIVPDAEASQIGHHEKKDLTEKDRWEMFVGKGLWSDSIKAGKGGGVVARGVSPIVPEQSVDASGYRERFCLDTPHYYRKYRD